MRTQVAKWLRAFWFSAQKVDLAEDAKLSNVWLKEADELLALIQGEQERDVVSLAYDAGYAYAKKSLAPQPERDREAAQELCRIYFEIAAEAIGGDAVRAKRDKLLGGQEDE